MAEFDVTEPKLTDIRAIERMMGDAGISSPGVGFRDQPDSFELQLSARLSENKKVKVRTTISKRKVITGKVIINKEERITHKLVSILTTEQVTETIAKLVKLLPKSKVAA